MTRISEITNIATERADRHEIEEANLYGGLCKLYSYSRIKNAEISSFIAGAEFADEHRETPWISAKEDLPCNHKELINPNFKKETLLVLAITPSGYAFFDYMVYTNVWFWNNKNYCHAYWFPIPELQKEQEIMHTFFQPKISVAQEEADIQELIDEEYERREQE